jgi:hypothetical protein
MKRISTNVADYSQYIQVTLIHKEMIMDEPFDHSSRRKGKTDGDYDFIRNCLYTNKGSID